MLEKEENPYLPEDYKKKLEKKINSKKYIALSTCKVHCNKLFDLIEGEEIPKDLAQPFIQSLITNKTIKEV